MSALPLIKTKSTIYFMERNQIHKGVVRARLELDDINVKYLVETSCGKRWMMDSLIFKSINDLIANLKSCVIA